MAASKRRAKVIHEVAKQLTVRNAKIYGPRGIREAHGLSAVEWWEAVLEAQRRGTPAVSEPSSFTLAEATAIQLAVLAALDNAAADLSPRTLRELGRARLKLDQLILFTQA